jgi:hypothetical protein
VDAANVLKNLRVLPRNCHLGRVAFGGRLTKEGWGRVHQPQAARGAIDWSPTEAEGTRQSNQAGVPWPLLSEKLRPASRGRRS